MKLDARQVAGFLRRPGPCRVVLLHGDDEGLIRERARELTLSVAGSLNDPFLVAELDRDGWSRITEEMTAMSLIGGRRVIRVREVTDAATEPVRAALRGAGDALLLLEAPELGKGKLRTLIEAAPDAAAIACYPEEGRALQDLIRAMLAELGASADAETVSWLAESLGGDRAVVRGEVEKLALLAGAGGRVDVEMARSSAGDAAGASADAGLLSATRGDPVAADHEVEAAIAEGVTAIALVRMALGHLQRLHQARLRMQDGLSAADAIRGLRPPVFFKAVGGMTASLALWPTESLARAIDEARTVEIACKQTGSRPELLVRRFVAGLARQAQGRMRA
ncbi:MAG: DNA polymerase III subunit delta [Rhodospirillales bacterium]